MYTLKLYCIPFSLTASGYILFNQARHTRYVIYPGERERGRGKVEMPQLTVCVCGDQLHLHSVRCNSITENDLLSWLKENLLFVGWRVVLLKLISYVTSSCTYQQCTGTCSCFVVSKYML